MAEIRANQEARNRQNSPKWLSTFGANYGTSKAMPKPELALDPQLVLEQEKKIC
jgi:hypothetical protein